MLIKKEPTKEEILKQSEKVIQELFDEHHASL